MFKQLTLITLITWILSSCANHSGMMTGNALLSENNFKVVGLAYGSENTTKFLGIGGLKKDALVLNAKKNLYANFPLKPGQALANVTVDFKNEWLLFVSKTKVIVSAEIIDFDLERAKNLEVEKSLLTGKQITRLNHISKGEKIYFKKGNNFFKGIVTKLEKNKVSIKYLDKDLHDRIATVSYSKAFKLNNVFDTPFKTKYKINDIVDIVNDLVFTTKGKVVGINEKGYLIEQESKLKFYVFSEIE